MSAINWQVLSVFRGLLLSYIAFKFFFVRLIMLDFHAWETNSLYKSVLLSSILPAQWIDKMKKEKWSQFLRVLKKIYIRGFRSLTQQWLWYPPSWTHAYGSLQYQTMVIDATMCTAYPEKADDKLCDFLVQLLTSFMISRSNWFRSSHFYFFMMFSFITCCYCYILIVFS